MNELLNVNIIELNYKKKVFSGPGQFHFFFSVSLLSDVNW